MTKQTPQPKHSLKEKLKEKFAKTTDKLHKKSEAIKLRIKTIKQRLKNSSANTAATIKNIKLPKLPKINFKIKLNLKKKKPEAETTPIAKTLPKGVKIIEKYPLYEPFAQVFIVQDPKRAKINTSSTSFSLTRWNVAYTLVS